MKSSERIIRGVVAAPGITMGHAVRAFDPTFISFNFKLRSDQVRPEMERFRAIRGQVAPPTPAHANPA